MPFFFIHIGLEIDPGALAPSIGLTIPLILIGVAGKLIGVGLPIWIRSGPKDALLLGISMIPRAEIAMLIFIQASLLDSTLVPAELLLGYGDCRDHYLCLLPIGFAKTE